MLANDSTQANGGDPFAKFNAVWAACVTPTGRKLVLLALANYANADGTGIRPAVATIAARCNISPKQARRHLLDLVEMGVLKLSRAAAQHRPAVYMMDFVALSALPQMGGLETASTPMHDPQTSHACPPDLPPTGVNPFKDPGDNPPPGGGGLPGPGFAGPVGVDTALWNRWVKKSRLGSDDLRELVERGVELRAEGADLDALVRQALNHNWRHWPRVEKAKPVRGSQLGQLGTADDWGMPT